MPPLAVAVPLVLVAVLAGVAALSANASVLELEGNRCVVKVRNVTKLLSLRSRIHLTARDIVSVKVVEDNEHLSDRGMPVRKLGTSIPFVIHAGRFSVGSRSEFWAFRPGQPYLRIDVLLPGLRVLRIRVTDPAGTVELLDRLAREGRSHRRDEGKRAAAAEPGLSSIVDSWESFPSRRDSS